MPETAVISNGLDGIVVAETKISEVDGERGRLIIRGRDAEELAFAATFEEACALLWSDALGEQDAESIKKAFGAARVEAFALITANPVLLTQNHPMDSLRTAASMLSGSTDTDLQSFARATATLSVFAVNWARTHRGEPLAQPDANLGHAADTLRMLRGTDASIHEASGLDTYLTTVSDHGMNASTFTARVVASTGSDNVSCVVAAIGALKGPLHGGAPGPVLDMLNEIAKPEAAEAWLEKELDSGKRIMGMGHRIYKVRDPRAAIFEQAISRLEAAGLAAPRLPLARAVELKAEEILAARHPEKPLKANVEFYTAILLDALQIPNELFSSMFAVGRAAGWCAHVAEQRKNGRLIRPASRYIGSVPR